MSDLIISFLETLGTYRVLEDHGVAIKDEGGAQLVPCPESGCGCSAKMVGRALVCTSLRCDWRVGNVVDYLVTSKGWTVRQTLERMRERYSQLLDSVDGRPWISAVDMLQTQFESSRALFNFLLARRGGPENMTAEIAHRLEAYQSQDIDLRHQRHTAFLLTAQDCIQLAELVSAVADAPLEYDGEIGATVIPYFSDFVTISHFHVLPFDTKDTVGSAVQWPVYPTRFAFSGLLELHGDRSKVTMTRHPFEAMRLNQRAHRLARSMIYLGMRRTSGWRKETTMRFDSCAYLIAEGEDLRQAAEAKLLTGGHGFCLGHVRSPESTHEWMGFLTHRFRTLLDCGKMEQVRDEMKMFLLTPAECAAWQDRLALEGPEELLQMLKEHAVTRKAIFRVRDAVVIETDNGYDIDKNGRGAVACCNFTLKFDRNIYFEDSMDLLHSGCVNFKGQPYPLLVSREELQRPQHIERAAQFAVNSKRGVLAATPSMPDKSLASYLVVLFHQQISDLPRMEGVRGLGWSRDRRRFNATDWAIDNNQILPRQTCPDPKSMVLRNYTFDPRPEAKPSARPSPAAGELLALLVGQVARVQRGRPAPPVLFLNTEENRAKLCRLFEGAFSQHSMVTLNWNGRSGTRDVEDLNGFPCLAVGKLPDDFEEKNPLPMIVLSDNGRMIDGDWEASDVGFVRNAFAAAVKWLTETNGTRISVADTGIYHTDLLEEGFDILEKSTGYNREDAIAETPVLDFILSQHAPTALGGFLQENFAKQRMVVALTKCPRSLRSRLIAELAQVDPTLIPGDFASIDLMKGRALLRGFYQLDPTLPPISTTLPTADEWKASASS